MTTHKDPSKQQLKSTGGRRLRMRRILRVSPRNAKAPIAENTTTTNHGLLSLRAMATLTVKNTVSELVIVDAIARDSQVPGVLHITAEPETIEVAYRHKWVRLSFLGTSFCTRVLGRIDEFAVLLVAAEPLFRALAKHLK